MLTGKRILLVEDEALVAMLLEDIVIELGAVPVGPEAQLAPAIARAETALIDAAILDINLQSEQTFGVADVLRRRGVPYAFATGSGTSGVAPVHQGVPVLTKPYAAEDVARVLAQLLG